MSVLNINIQEPYFTLIKQGKKTVEGRLGKAKFKKVKKGDILIINEELNYEIKEITIYPTFKEMLIMEGVKNVIPDALNLDEAVSVYYKFYTPEDEKDLQVYAIRI